MVPVQHPSEARSALIHWYQDAEPTFEDLDACSVMATEMTVGSASSNLDVVADLDELTRTADLWFLMNPCPYKGFGLSMSAITAFFTAFGRLIFCYGGNFEAADDGTLASRVESTCFLLVDMKSMALRYTT